MVDFGVELVRPEKGPPPLEDGVGDLEYADVGLGIRGREAADEILEDERFVRVCNMEQRARGPIHLGQSAPSHPKIGVGDDGTGIAELGLNSGRRRDHQPNKLFFDIVDLILGYLVVSLLVLSQSSGQGIMVSGMGKLC